MCHNIGCLDPQNFKEFELVKRTQLSHNVAKFKFALPTPMSVLGLPIGQHMSCRFLFHGFVFFTYPHRQTKPIRILIFNCTRLVSCFMVYHVFFLHFSSLSSTEEKIVLVMKWLNHIPQQLWILMLDTLN